MLGALRDISGSTARARHSLHLYWVDNPCFPSVNAAIAVPELLTVLLTAVRETSRGDVPSDSCFNSFFGP
jgi:hypothetical protein